LVKEGLIPAVVYGKHLQAPLTVSCIKNDFLKRYKEAGYSTPITLKGKDINQMVLIQDLQIDPVTNNLLHIDFLAINKDEKVTTEVPIILTGESLIEKLGEGKIQLIKDFVEVEALPQDLPHNITIDISVIKTMNDTIFIKDLQVSSKVTILDDLEQAVITVLKLAEEEVAPAPTAATAAAPAA
jgi:large subunit ribosomal protein L25